MSNEYLIKRDEAYIDKSKKLLSGLPGYVKQFYDSKKGSKKELTRHAYIIDIRDFLSYLSGIHGCDVATFPFEILGKLTVQDIDEYKKALFQEYSPASVKRKLASLSSFYKYMVLAGYVENNPASIIDWPKEDKSKAIIYLDQDQTAALLSGILRNDLQMYYLDENGELITSSVKTSDANKGVAKNKHSKYVVGAISDRTRRRREPVKLRNYLMILIFLKTGVRVSELVSIDLDDINFKSTIINVTGKGAKVRPVSLNEQDSSGRQVIIEMLKDYIQGERENLTRKNPSETALFVSNRGTRLTVRQVETMVKEMVQTYLYGEEFLKTENFSPHKLRSTCATRLLDQTGDIKGVSDLLGHESIEITARKYAALEKKKNAERMGQNSLLR